MIASFTSVDDEIERLHLAGLKVREIQERTGWGRGAVSNALRRRGHHLEHAHNVRLPLAQRWTDEEIAVMQPAETFHEAVILHRAAFPDSTRGPRSYEWGYRRYVRGTAC